MKTSRFCVGLAAAAFASSVSAGNIDLSTVTWFKSRAGDVITVDSAGKTVTFTEAQASASLFVANVPDVAVNIGETLVVTYVFNVLSVTAGSGNAIRFGVFDSNGTLVGSGLNSDTNTAFDNDLGYMTSITASGLSAGLYGRNLTATTPASLLGTTGSGYYNALTGTTSGTNGAFAGGNTYTMVQTITRNSASTDYSVSINGGAFSNYTLSANDSTSGSAGAVGADTFNMIGIRVAGGNATWGALTLTSLDMTVTSSAIPEPSTYAAVAGLGILGFALSRRRR